MHAPTEESTITHQHQINMAFPNHSKEEVIYPLTVKDIAQAQEDDSVLKKLSKTDNYSTQLGGGTQVQCKDGTMVIPKVLQHRAVCWYHHYLQHHGHTHLEETLHAAMYWKGMRNTIDHMQQCIGKVKTVVHVRLANNTSTSRGSSLQSLSSQTLGKLCV